MIEFRGKRKVFVEAIIFIASASRIIGVYEVLFFLKKLTTNSATPPTVFNPQPSETTL